MTAEITQRISDQNKRPKKTFISPSTRGVGYAMYYKALQKRVEEVGTLSFPQQNGRKLYGELVMYIPVFQDGSIYEKEGGPRVERSSGNRALDQAALGIVRRAAPFGKFPANMRSTDKDDLWIVITTFKFTREGKLQAELRGEKAEGHERQVLRDRQSDRPQPVAGHPCRLRGQTGQDIATSAAWRRWTASPRPCAG
jgi:protein TonB